MLLLFNCQVLSDSLWSHGLQHDRLPCPSPSPGVCPSSCLLHQWCHPTISSSVALFSCLQAFPASESFPLCWLFTSDGQNIGASASGTVLPMNICRLISFKFDWLTSLLSKELLKVFSSTTVGKHQFFSALPSLWPSSHNRIERPYIALTIQTFVCKVVSLFFNTLSRFVIAFLPRSNHLLISRLQHLYWFKIYRSCTNNNCS